MLEESELVTACLYPSAHDQTPNSEIIQLRDNGNGPSKIIKSGSELAHGDQGLTSDSSLVSINLKNVHQVDLDRIHARLVAHDH